MAETQNLQDRCDRHNFRHARLHVSLFLLSPAVV